MLKGVKRLGIKGFWETVGYRDMPDAADFVPEVLRDVIFKVPKTTLKICNR